MRSGGYLLLLVLLSLLPACGRAPAPFPAWTVVDLTHAFDASTTAAR